jgi:PAS domain S-box-containing protein
LPRRLYLQVVLSLAIGLVAVVAPIGWWIGRTQGQTHLRDMRDHALAMAGSQAENAAHFLVIEEYAGLEQQLLEGARLPGVLSLRLFEPGGKVLVDAHRDRDADPPHVGYTLGTGALPSRTELHAVEEPDRLVVWAPVTAGSLLGWIETTWSLGPVKAMQASIWRQAFLLGLVWATLAVVIVTLVLRRPMTVIRELSLFARDLARRKGERLAIRHRSDEIGLLASALDHASVELADAERQLVSERERLAITLQSIGEAVLACDSAGRVTLMNGVAEALTGWTAGDAVGRPFEEVFRVLDDETGEPIASTLQRSIDTGHVAATGGTVALLARDGIRRPVSDSGAPIVDAGGKVIGAVVVFRDETQRLEAERVQRDLEQQLRHAQKMEAIGHLAGGIAHDFNNILTGIIGYGSLLVELSPPGDERREPAEEVVQAARRATTLTRGLLAFSRKQKMEPRLVDVNDVIRGVERMLRRIIGEEVELRTDLAAGPLVVNADAAALDQVLMNLATNARDAMPGGGLLGISTRRVELDEPPLPGAGPALRGPFVLVAVSDSGSGMPPETVRRIFEPFFTTKEAGRGTGLGLSIVHGIVQQHGGTIRVESQPGLGTTFQIFLPLDPGTPASRGGEEAAPVPGGNERILLVEDEVDVRRVARAILERGGYRVVEAANGLEGLALAEREGAPFRLVVCDVIMPRMNGREFRDRLRVHRPDLPVLFISGYTADLIARRGLLEDQVDLLLKPFTARELLARVRELLDRKRG